MTPGNSADCLPVLVHELVSDRLVQNASLIAVRFATTEITYLQLFQKARRIAALLHHNCKDESIIGISTRRHPDTIAGVLGILMSGKAYLPLDPAYPRDRLRQIITDSGIRSCLADMTETGLLSGGAFKAIAYPAENHQPDIYDQAFDKKYPAAQPDPLAYILYTSGSTGKPKGVSMGHGALVNLLQWQSKESVAREGTNTLQFAPLTFDVSFQEIFSTLTTGGTLILVADDIRLDPFRLLAYIREQSVNRIFLPFVALQQLAESAGSNNYFPGCLREVMTAGEQLKITPQLVRLFSQIPDCKLFNQYGPTEAHVVTQLILDGNASLWPALPGIGSPIANTGIYIVDQNRKLLPDGETGELIIAGNCLAAGYLNQPALTDTKFIYWNHPELGRMRVYLSGDLARYLPDGNIEFLGRIDDQVKIRGHRVEPGEIEIMLNNYPGVEQAVVIARPDKSGQKRILAYLKAGNAALNINDVRQHLENSLPGYMVPSAFVAIDEFPKTGSGKIDKKALPEVEIKRPELDTLFVSPDTQTEKLLAAEWSLLLEMDQVGVNDNFFELGGNSLLAVKTVVALREKHGLALPVTKLYSTPTVRQLAGFLDNGDQELQKSRVHKPGNSSDVAVIGMAGRFPGADSVLEFWANLINEKETTSFFSFEELDRNIPDELKNNPAYVRARGILKDADMFDAAFFGINPRVAALMDPQQRLFMEIAWEVLEESGYLPTHFKGTTGVFAGAGNNTYFLNNVQSNTELIGQVGAFQVMTANEKDYIATRTAFQLNLKGPAISLNTGCSTSLLAISQAVENIRSGRCDLAIAGGVAITAPLKSGHLYEEGAMLSRDGHCRPFDAKAGGTVFSDGAGVVLLKKLETAVADGDTVYAIVKGIGINNDGGDKSSFTAPSAQGQAAAIKQAIEDAGVNAAAIEYIETHGTATPLGDPIEIEGLKNAFGKQAVSHYCAIGSVKSNIGHLTAAAGVAGFIKAVLSVYHRKIPASINFDSPNPDIEFASSPFYVNTHLREWTTAERIAGVSSFGVGGTNVHIVLQSAGQPQPVQNQPKPAQLFQISAKVAESVTSYASKLARHLEGQPATSIQDIAYSLRSTRQVFNHRRFVVAGNNLEAIAKLKAPALPSEQHLLTREPAKIAFVFPGQGAQFVNMGAELYEHEEVFKAAIDECAYLFYELTKEDIRKVIFEDKRKDNPGAESNNNQLHNTRYTQPAMFIFEYALARLWMSWGIQPSALMGHSIGEFVAAHLAGVFNLSDSIMLIEARGRLMAALPHGSMMSVLADSEKVTSLLPSTLSIAAVNSSKSTVVAGPDEEINRFAALLDKAEIGHKKLLTSHAFHSRMMEAVRLPFEDIVRTVNRGRPTIPVISTVSGKPLTDAEAMDPGYWSNHLMTTVRFADAVDHILAGPPMVFLEIGPRSVTTSLIRQHAAARNVVAIASQHPDASGHHAYAELLQAVGQLWLHGININFSHLTDKSVSNRVNLPSYAFERKRYWVEPKANDQSAAVAPRTRYSSPAAEPVNKQNAESVIETKTGEQDNRRASLVTTIRNILEQASGLDMSEVPGSTGFVEAGLDSLLLTQVALTLKKTFSVPVSFRQLNADCNTIDKLADYYHANTVTDSISAVETATAAVLPRELMDEPVKVDAALSIILEKINLLTEQVARLQSQQIYATARLEPVEKPSNGSNTVTVENNRPVFRIESDAPVPGARLGKDKSGNPAWFITDPAEPGRYLQLIKK